MPAMPDKKSPFNELTGARLTLAIEAIKVKRSLTARAIAKEIGTSETALANWQAGRAAPQPEPLAVAKQRYGLSLDWLYAGDAANLPEWLADKVLKPQLVDAVPAKSGAIEDRAPTKIRASRKRIRK